MVGNCFVRRLALSGQRRSGSTLFEILLVMAILLVGGAISIPLIAPMMSSNDLQAARDLVRARWTEMRTRAASEGRGYSFSLVENSGKFRIAPADDDPSNSGQSPGSDQKPWIVEESLPGKVQFLKLQSDKVNSSSGQGGKGSYTAVLTFLPDGTARENVQVAFGQDGKGNLLLKVRGHTGAISAEDAAP
jgi:Tfp pilus assembly protein FimT